MSIWYTGTKFSMSTNTSWSFNPRALRRWLKTSIRWFISESTSIGGLAHLRQVEDGQVAVGRDVHHGVHLQHEQVALYGGLDGLLRLLEEERLVLS